MTIKKEGMVTLHRESSRVRPSKRERYSMIDSLSPCTLLKIERSEEKAFDTESG